MDEQTPRSKPPNKTINSPEATVTGAEPLQTPESSVLDGR